MRKQLTSTELLEQQKIKDFITKCNQFNTIKGVKLNVLGGI